MYRDGKQILTSKVHNFVMNHAALGDIISSLPAIVFARQFYSNDLVLKAWVPPWQMELIAHLLAPYGPVEVCDLTKFPRERAKRIDWDGGPTSLNTAVHNTHTRNRVSMVDYAFNFMLDAQPEDRFQKSYPTRAPLGKRVIDRKYVVFPVGATSDNKLFKAAVMTPVLEWCLAKGYLPVFTGTKTSHTQAEVQGELKPIVIREESHLIPPSVWKQCHDLRETTTLLELRDLCGHAAAVVGVDGGTLHLAGTTHVPIVYGIGTAEPKHRLIYREGDPSYRIRFIIPRGLECWGCQSHWPLLSLDYRHCVYGDSKCMDSLSPVDFIDGLKELGL